MSDKRADIVKELLTLSSGAGLNGHDLDALPIPWLREYSGTKSGPEDDLRRKLSRFLADVVADLASKQRRVATGLLGLSDSTGTRLTERVDHLAGEFRVHGRTVRRWWTDAAGEMAISITTGAWAKEGEGHGGDGWYVDELEVAIQLQGDTVRSVERRTIVSTVESLDRVTNSVDILPAESGSIMPRLEVMFGAVTAPKWTISGRNFRSEILLPRTLARGDRHTYEIVVTAPRTAPHFVCMPLRRHNAFSVTVRFDPAEPPAAAWVLDGVLGRQIDLCEPTENRLTPDRAGEVRYSFGQLRRGFVYGIQWIS